MPVQTTRPHVPLSWRSTDVRRWDRRRLISPLIGAVMALVSASDVAAQPTDRFYVSTGWAFGISSNPLTGEALSGEDATDKDEAPLINITGIFGSAIGEVEAKMILGNFGRLVELVNPPTGMESSDAMNGAEMTAESNASEEPVEQSVVRRALVADLTLRFGKFRSLGAGFQIAPTFNAGFIFDAGSDDETRRLDDAASHWFVGVSIKGTVGDSHMVVDLLGGASELLTGRDAFDLLGPLRLRPRARFHLENILADRPMDIGFWADLGVKNKDRDAVTVFAAIPILKAPSP